MKGFVPSPGPTTKNIYNIESSDDRSYLQIYKHMLSVTSSTKIFLCVSVESRWARHTQNMPQLLR